MERPTSATGESGEPPPAVFFVAGFFAATAFFDVERFLAMGSGYPYGPTSAQRARHDGNVISAMESPRAEKVAGAR